MRDVCLGELETYISRRHNTVSQYIATRPILDLCLEEENFPGAWVEKLLW